MFLQSDEILALRTEITMSLLAMNVWTHILSIIAYKLYYVLITSDLTEFPKLEGQGTMFY